MNGEQTVLLLLPSRREVYPLSPAALTRAQSSRTKLATDYRDALILERNGTLRQIEHIEVLGPLGESVGRRVLSRLTDAWRIAVRLSEPLSWGVDRVTQLLAGCIAERGQFGFPDMEDPSTRRRAAEAILAATSAADVFNILPMPDPEDSLDVL
jgi:hypothetical protein